MRYLNALLQRKNGRCLTGQDVGVRGKPDLAKKYFQKNVVDLETETGQRPTVLEYAIFHDTGAWMTVSEQKAMQKEILARWREGHLIYLNLRPAHPAGIPLMLEEGVPKWAEPIWSKYSLVLK
ncbi:MAG: hypothetical protein HQL32_06980 [Planctomycetes bacterium]|nr:hypothetical protein [Planctomycetota bacterium]